MPRQTKPAEIKSVTPDMLLACMAKEEFRLWFTTRFSDFVSAADLDITQADIKKDIERLFYF